MTRELGGSTRSLRGGSLAEAAVNPALRGEVRQARHRPQRDDRERGDDALAEKLRRHIGAKTRVRDLVACRVERSLDQMGRRAVNQELARELEKRWHRSAFVLRVALPRPARAFRFCDLVGRRHMSGRVAPSPLVHRHERARPSKRPAYEARGRLAIGRQVAHAADRRVLVEE